MRKKQLLKTGISMLLASVMVFTSVPMTSQAAEAGQAPAPAVAEADGADLVESLEPGKYYLTVYSKTTLSYEKGNTATGANLEQEAQSVYMAVSKDGQNFEVLNSGGGVIFSKNIEGTLRVTNPKVFKDDSGKFTVVAPDNNAAKGIHVFTSEDGVRYYDDELVESTELDAATLNKEKFTLMLNGENILDTDATISLGNAVELTEAEYKHIVDKLGTVVNTGLESLQDLSVASTAQVTESTLAAKYPSVNATYTDGSTQKFNIDWTNALQGVDLTKPGSYTVNGKVIQTKYLNNLKELNNSSLPEDDPENIGGEEFPDNYNPETGDVYYDETKFIEGMADPFIYWDEVTGYYYMTSSYFPEDSDAMDGETPEQYDRVVLRRGRTLEELQTRAKQVTIWKVGNQGYDDNGNDVASGYRYIWAPEIHRVGDKWVVYFTESHSRSDAYNIYCHALVLEGDRDPYDTALEFYTEESAWTDYKMCLEDGVVDKEGKPAVDPFSYAFCLDMTYFKDAVNGQSYVIWAGKPTAAYQGGNTDLFIATVNEEEPWKITSAATRVTYSDYGWERISYCVNEGATILQRDGNIYMCYSAAGTGSEYSIGMCKAKAGADLLNLENWTKSPYPLLASRDVNGEEGPGHNSFTVDKDGNAIFVYHARPTSHNYQKCGKYNGNPLNDPCRHARLKRVHWAADGEPILKMTYENELKDEYKTVSLKINVQNTVVPSITLDKTALGIEAGKNATLKATAVPNAAVTWKSSDDKVAAVNNGVITAKKAGTATITATANGKSATCKVTVVSLDKKKVTLGVGEKVTLKVSGTKNVSWSSSSKNVAVSKGKITAKKKGKATITAKAEGVELKCTVTVKAAPKKLILKSKKKVTIKKNKTTKIKVSLPKNTAGALKYKSSKKAVASVDAKGVVKGKKKGTAKITVTAANNKKAKVTVTVTVK